jgi:hypothetical protein
MKLENATSFPSVLRRVIDRSGKKYAIVCDAAMPLFYEIDGDASGFAMRCDGIFESCSDEEAKVLLEYFITLEDRSRLGWNLACQLSRLLAVKGLLVADKIDHIIQETDWTTFSAPHLLLSGAIHLRDSERIISDLLDRVPEDFRDGLFCACYYSDSSAVAQKVASKFEEWGRDLAWSPTATGEHGWLELLIKKWMGRCSVESLMSVITLYFKFI